MYTFPYLLRNTA